jgi:hypothetical protein
MAMLASITLVSMPLATAQTQSQHSSKCVKFGTVDDLRSCSETENKHGFQYKVVQIWLPIMRKDGKPVLSWEMCNQIRCRPDDCEIIFKIKPVIAGDCGEEEKIEFRHFNPRHCPGDEKIWDAILCLWRDIKSLCWDRKAWVCFAPEANMPECSYWAEGKNNNAPDYRMAYRQFWQGASEVRCWNVRSLWSISRPYWGCTPMDKLYPGHDYVDGYGLAAYAKPEWYGGWLPSFCELIGWTYCDFMQQFGCKPVIVETGVSRCGRSSEWLWDAAKECKQFPWLYAVTCNNTRECDDRDWRHCDLDFGPKGYKGVVDCFHGNQ